MNRPVTGIGGIFFKSRDAKALQEWYRAHLGLETDPAVGGVLFRWREEHDSLHVAQTVWSIFPDTTKYLEPGRASFMINYRVADLGALVEQLRSAGVQVEPNIQDEPYGRFAWILDPDGNKIELWEPRGE